MKYGIVMGGIIDLETQKIASAKEVFDYMRELHENSEKLRKALEIAKLVTEEKRSEPCRFDHNGNCQEHSWFGLENENCPVKELNEALEELR